MHTAMEIAPRLGVAPTCDALGVARASYYRRRTPRAPVKAERQSPRARSSAERAVVIEVLHEPRFVDLAPAQVYASLLDEERYLCSLRTMYRILAAQGEVRERRNQLRHPHYVRPELLRDRPQPALELGHHQAQGAGEVDLLLSLRDPRRVQPLRRRLDGAHRESNTLAQRLIAETYKRQAIEPKQLTIHADRGSSMKSKPVALLLADLGVTKTHSRPHVSNDTPYSEAQFRTLKYRPEFPARFGSIEDARGITADLLRWYNPDHHHVGLGLMTPYDVHSGQAQAKLAERARVLAAAFVAHPERFPHGPPVPPELPKEAWINRPITTSMLDEIAH